MKQRYFSPENLQSEARAMLAGLPRTRQDRGSTPDSSQAALLVLDMQKYFFEPGSHAFVPSAPAILPGVQSMITAFARLERPIVFSQHINTTEDAGMMGVWWRDLIRPNDPMNEQIDELDTTTGIVLRKSQYDAFYQTGLEERLRLCGANQVVICGVMTHLCCETTARSAFMRGFGVYFTVDGTATYNREFHAATILNLSHGFAVPILIEQVLAALNAAPTNG